MVHAFAIADMPLEKGSYFVDCTSLSEGEAVVRYVDSRLGPGWMVFRSPPSILVASSLEEVSSVVAAAADFASAGAYAVGFLSYEAGQALNPALSGLASSGPFAAFALYDSAPSFSRELKPVYSQVQVEIGDYSSFDEYRTKFDLVKQALAAGESYQINLTFALPFTLDGSAASFFANRCGVDPPPYAAFMRFGELSIASFSPELLYERSGSQVMMRPMKGTRLATGSAVEMAADDKSIAENIMIVDMVRNDLGSLASVGSVSASRLLQVERHRGLLQMVSEVTASVDASCPNLLKAVFPAASITGAPKVETTRLIAENEDRARGVYCGAIGYMYPGGERFSVAIRTASLLGERGEFGVGSGLIWDSVAEDEYAECLAKSEVLVSAGSPWELVTALHRDHLGDASIVKRHLDRLASGASSVGLELCRDRVLESLSSFESEGEKVRIAVRADGSVVVSSGPSATRSGVVTAVLASTSVIAADPNLCLKSTSRAQYEAELDSHLDSDEVLLWDADGRLTEFCRGSVILALDKRLVTPWLSKGHLKSIAIERLIELGMVEAGSPTVEDLVRAKAVYFANAVVGVLPVELHFDGAVIKPDLERARLLSEPLDNR